MRQGSIKGRINLMVRDHARKDIEDFVFATRLEEIIVVDPLTVETGRIHQGFRAGIAAKILTIGDATTCRLWDVAAD